MQHMTNNNHAQYIVIVNESFVLSVCGRASSATVCVCGTSVWVFLCGARRGGRRSAVGRRRQFTCERHGAAALSTRRALVRDPNNFVHWKLFKAIPDGSDSRGSLSFRISSRVVK
ncbi:hypothetical protein B5X24_HaOG202548 [Helicoverpa armigera]|uniref:Uncharacterized protein n=1 Tax=Helicoverpa armigera TaxID=29058 RepID=A0A2W1C215_HELAM|nr:hypothetical protein B5X24_HaOG202548 [Helicoverpa armigera]